MDSDSTHGLERFERVAADAIRIYSMFPGE